MTLQDTIEQYVAWRQARGSEFVSGTRILRQYARSVGGDIACDAVRPEQARKFLAGTGPLTRTRSVKRSALNGFYRYALGRGLATRSPLPADEPPEPASAPPYIYSPDDLRRLFAALEPCRRRAVQLDAPTFRTLLLLLYGAGLRLGEALRLARQDVDLPSAVLTIRGTKFYQTRLVPVGADLGRALASYAATRAACPLRPRARRAFSPTATAARSSREPSTRPSTPCAARPACATRRVPATNRASTISGTHSPQGASNLGTGRVPTCNACCRFWPPIWGTSTSPGPRSISR